MIRFHRRAMAAVATLLMAGAAHADNLTASDVGRIIAQAVQEATAHKAPATIAVVDRVGSVLAVYQMAGSNDTTGTTSVRANLNTGGKHTIFVESNPHGANTGLSGAAVPDFDGAISKAVTAAYVSTSHGNAFSTRTASQIIQEHFDPGELNTPSGPLYGVQFSQLPCSDVVVHAVPADPSSISRGPHRAPLGMAGDPGGFPLYKNHELVGAVGVIADGMYGLDLNIHVNDHSLDETIALAAQTGFDAPMDIRADQITVGGHTLRFSDAGVSDLLSVPANAPAFSTLGAATGALITVVGYYDSTAGLRDGSQYGTLASGLRPDTTGAFGVTTVPVNLGRPRIGAYFVRNQPAYPLVLVDGNNQPRFPIVAGSGVGGLTAAEVQAILSSAYQLSLQVRAQIRNPLNSPAALNITVVDANGAILGIVSNPDSALFGIDVSAQKARSALFMSEGIAGQQLSAVTGLQKYVSQAQNFFGSQALTGRIAYSERAIGNLGRSTYPDGIDGTPNGPFAEAAATSTPFSTGLQLDLVIGNIVTNVLYSAGASPTDTPACTAPGLPTPSGSPVNAPILANGLQIFPGGFPIYRNGFIVGAIGVSGDGVDQDDLTGFLGLYNAGQAMPSSGLSNAPAGIRADKLTAFGSAPRYVNCPFSPLLTGTSQDLCQSK